MTEAKSRTFRFHEKSSQGAGTLYVRMQAYKLRVDRNGVEIEQVLSSSSLPRTVQTGLPSSSIGH